MSSQNELLTPILFDEIYGIYLTLEEEGAEQPEIIEEIKFILSNKGYSEQERNLIISMFLERFDIIFTPEEINNIQSNLMSNQNDDLVHDSDLDSDLEENNIINNTNNDFAHGPIGDALINMFNLINPEPLQNPQENSQQQIMEDVVVTLDKEEIKDLKEYDLEEDLEGTCPISLNELKKGTKVIKLPCDHIYEAESIKTYLEKYNYKCPVCRKEVGKGKHNL